MSKDTMNNKKSNPTPTSLESSTRSTTATTTTPCTKSMICHLLSAIVLHDLFVYSIVSVGGINWIVFGIIMAIVPVWAGVVYVWCHDASVLTRLLSRIFFSTAAICGVVYLIIGSLWIYDDRRTSFVVLSTVGLFMSLYYWYVIEKYVLVNGYTTTTNNNNNNNNNNNEEEETTKEAIDVEMA